MNPLIARLLVLFGIVAAVVIGVRATFFSPNNEVDSGLQVAGVVEGTPTGSSSYDLPSRLEIPKLKVDAKVQHVGVTKTGNMAAPNNFTDVSWYKFGTVPGSMGSAVMAGHVDNALGTPAVFIDLPKLVVGDDVYVTDRDGKRLHYKVVDKQIYEYNKAPAEKIFNAADGKYLNLITCQGEWVPEAKSARFRLVVYTELVE